MYLNRGHRVMDGFADTVTLDLQRALEGPAFPVFANVNNDSGEKSREPRTNINLKLASWIDGSTSLLRGVERR